MSNVTALMRKVTARVHRFGHAFEVQYKAGNTPSVSDPEASILVDGAHNGWLAVSTMSDDWEDISLGLVSDDQLIVQSSMLGLPDEVAEKDDFRFMFEAESYLLSLLADELGRLLGASPKEEGDTEVAPDPRNMHPLERGQRVATAWHNAGKDPKALPDLVAIEVYDALDAMGHSLADVLDEDAADEEPTPREGCGNLISGLVETTLQAWHEGDTDDEE